jgi:hypothetical protein
MRPAWFHLAKGSYARQAVRYQNMAWLCDLR